MDYSSLGTVTGACHAPVAGGQGKAPRIPVPIEKPADFEMDGREDFQNSLCLWAAALKQIDRVVDMGFTHRAGHSFHHDGILEHNSFLLILLVLANLSAK